MYLTFFSLQFNKHNTEVIVFGDRRTLRTSATVRSVRLRLQNKAEILVDSDLDFKSAYYHLQNISKENLSLHLFDLTTDLYGDSFSAKELTYCCWFIKRWMVWGQNTFLIYCYVVNHADPSGHLGTGLLPCPQSPDWSNVQFLCSTYWMWNKLPENCRSTATLSSFGSMPIYHDL